MSTFASFAIMFAAAGLVSTTALADKPDVCADPEAARKWVKTCMQENPYNTKEACEQRALEKFFSGNNAR